MANTAVRRLLSNHLGIIAQEADAFLGPRGFFSALEVTGNVGNMYTGAIYLNLMATLYQQYKVLGNDIVGKKILFSSYGSGNTMVVFEGRVMEEAPGIIERWKANDFLNHYSDVEFEAYQEWLGRSYTTSFADHYSSHIPHKVSAGSFYLGAIREDGYREYFYKSNL